ncbi:MAG: septum formation protein Maf [Bacteroidetes bacterium CG18_big_fil_WC_8_21_14_2_50_41_14]|nr:MAG: septum formation protein Maf [Bacteroidetes bacterium CG18_big_fil_WC_8_21_14_2_50_41_14]PIY30463.1 MAG: septum formation protein Maf [Bacteroidetes bacterium CG_4_10_14_3_um_filter_42_6]PJB59848.1 MAG: septum formation protein Maf [Bacteroidetes bacterium CG_4_9_14_3_um_filter_41_19]
MMLHDLLKPYDVILASGSPRRRELLTEMGINFTVRTKPGDESFSSTMPIHQVPGYLSEQKAIAFASDELNDNQLVITADTIVVLENQILNKPFNPEEAYDMLELLSGKTHRVITGVTLMTTVKTHTFSVTTEVVFKKLTPDEIRYYVQNYKPFDKAGAYGIQEWIGHVAIERVDGSYFNVMGLPTHRLYEELIHFLTK